MVEIKEIDDLLQELYPVIDQEASNNTTPKPDIEINTVLNEPDQFLNEIDTETFNELKTEPDTLKHEYIGLTCNAGFFKHIINLHSAIVNETVLKMHKDHIGILNVDPANVCMIQQKIPINNLDEYKNINQSNDDYIKIGVDLDKLSYTFKNITKNDLFKLEYDNQDDDNSIQLTNGMFKQKMGVIDPAGFMGPKLPNLNLPGEFIIDTKMFYNFLVQASRVSDYVNISINHEGVTLFAEGDMDNVKLNIPKAMLEYHNTDTYYKSLFSIDYLVNTFRHIKTMFNKVTMNIGNDNPLRVTASDLTELTLLLAPRIEED